MSMYGIFTVTVASTPCFILFLTTGLVSKVLAWGIGLEKMAPLVIPAKKSRFSKLR